jgi:hypothetical protein
MVQSSGLVACGVLMLQPGMALTSRLATRCHMHARAAWITAQPSSAVSRSCAGRCSGVRQRRAWSAVAQPLQCTAAGEASQSDVSSEEDLLAMPFSQLKLLGSEKGVPGKQRRTIVAQLLAQQPEQGSKPAVSTAGGASSSNVASAAAGLELADQTFEEVCASDMYCYRWRL